jgi:hypothetical protein
MGVEGFEWIDERGFDTEDLKSSLFGGLEWSGANTLFDGIVDSNTYWFAVGSFKKFGNEEVYPGPTGIQVSQVRLYVQTPKLPAWTLVLNHEMPELFEKNEWQRGKEGDKLYSNLKGIESYRSSQDDKITFMLDWPDVTEGEQGKTFHTWKQTTNPVNGYDIASTGTGGVSGYEALDVTSGLAEGFGGLEHNNQKALFDGIVSSDFWFYAVGAMMKHDGGIPGPEPHVVQICKLYIMTSPDVAEKIMLENTANALGKKYDSTSTDTAFGRIAQNQAELQFLSQGAFDFKYERNVAVKDSVISGYPKAYIVRNSADTASWTQTYPISNIFEGRAKTDLDNAGRFVARCIPSCDFVVDLGQDFYIQRISFWNGIDGMISKGYDAHTISKWSGDDSDMTLAQRLASGSSWTNVVVNTETSTAEASHDQFISDSIPSTYFRARHLRISIKVGGDSIIRMFELVVDAAEPVLLPRGLAGTIGGPAHLDDEKVIVSTLSSRREGYPKAFMNRDPSEDTTWKSKYPISNIFEGGSWSDNPVDGRFVAKCSPTCTLIVDLGKEFFIREVSFWNGINGINNGYESHTISKWTGSSEDDPSLSMADRLAINQWSDVVVNTVANTAEAKYEMFFDDTVVGAGYFRARFLRLIVEVPTIRMHELVVKASYPLTMSESITKVSDEVLAMKANLVENNVSIMALNNAVGVPEAGQTKSVFEEITLAKQDLATSFANADVQVKADIAEMYYKKDVTMTRQDISDTFMTKQAGTELIGQPTNTAKTVYDQIAALNEAVGNAPSGKSAHDEIISAKQDLTTSFTNADVQVKADIAEMYYGKVETMTRVQIKEADDTVMTDVAQLYYQKAQTMTADAIRLADVQVKNDISTLYYDKGEIYTKTEVDSADNVVRNNIAALYMPKTDTYGKAMLFTQSEVEEKIKNAVVEAVDKAVKKAVNDTLSQIEPQCIANMRKRRAAGCLAQGPTSASASSGGGGSGGVAMFAGLGAAVVVVIVLSVILIKKNRSAKEGGGERHSIEGDRAGVLSFENPMYQQGSVANPMYTEGAEDMDMYDDLDAGNYDDAMYDETTMPEGTDDAGYLAVDAKNDEYDDNLGEGDATYDDM